MTYEQVKNLEWTLLYELGDLELLDEILLAMDTDTKADIYQWIARMHDIEY